MLVRVCIASGNRPKEEIILTFDSNKISKDCSKVNDYCLFYVIIKMKDMMN